MKSRLFSNLLTLLLLSSTPVAAQTDTMPITVQPDRIIIGKEFVPRFLDLPQVKQVKAGEFFLLPLTSTWDYIEVAGTLRCPPGVTVKVTHLFILPGGVSECGTGQIIIRDVPINTARDPFQWGNGILNFGLRTWISSTTLPWTPLTTEVQAGDVSLTLNSPPVGWKVGDMLEITDTRQPTHETSIPLSPRRELNVTVSAITGSVVLLSRPLTFAHLAIREPNGNLVALPRVANLTRSLVVKSENANGTPGHVADVGHGAMWTVKYVLYDSLGRTRNVSLNDASPDATQPSGFKPGKNQRGRYGDHHHHAMGFGSSEIGNAYIGHPDLPIIGPNGALLTFGPKWAGIVLHNVSDGLYQDNVSILSAGAGFVSEDGNEVRNILLHNFAAFNVGNHDGTVNAEFQDTVNSNNPGAAGNGYFMRGAFNTVDSNEAWNNPIGMNRFSVIDSPLLFPSKPGVLGDTPMTELHTVPFVFQNNVTNANGIAGLEDWFQPETPTLNHLAAFNGQWQFLQGTSTLTRPNFTNAWFVGDGGTTTCMGGTIAYVETWKQVGGRAVGCGIGGSGGLARNVSITGTTFQNVVNLDFTSMPDQGATLTDLTFLPLPGIPLHTLTFGRSNATCWDGVSPLGHMEGIAWESQRGSLWSAKNWNGDGKSYQLFNACQLGSLPAMYSVADNTESVFASPEVGLTGLQAWNKYGLALDGEAVDDTKTTTLPGLINGFARIGTSSTLGPPRFIITSPTLRAPAFVFDDGSPKRQIRMYGLMTGRIADAPGVGYLSIDGGLPFIAAQSPVEKFWSDDRRPQFDAPADGPHTARSWRSDANNVLIPSTLMTFQFTVGAFVPPLTVAVPNLVGQTQAAATASLLSIHLIVGTVTPKVDAAPLGQVLSQSPTSGAQATINSQVNLVVSSGPPPPPPPTLDTYTFSTPKAIYTFTCNPALSTCTYSVVLR